MKLPNTFTSTIDIYTQTSLTHDSYNNDNPLLSSMRTCMCQHCSTQTHSSPEGDRQGVALTPFQYKQQIKKLKSTIAPKSLPKIHTSTSGSDCPRILLDQIFPADFSKLTQSRNHTVAVKTFPHRTLE
ncbi:hypothetical protein O181_126956 [Austropuccinia psidii MF-1]|uniref:Uncharacterized protein n=1 Tax=Austropuccinia psidii MF-1 TaxID=1389203 RepID=A0A9Q3Q6D2_9BASI|nr:hypothetical protein [Austropuccinia psidii MF-1]